MGIRCTEEAIRPAENLSGHDTEARSKEAFSPFYVSHSNPERSCL
jgi:hypothetical protein